MDERTEVAELALVAGEPLVAQMTRALVEPKEKPAAVVPMRLAVRLTHPSRKPTNADPIGPRARVAPALHRPRWHQKEGRRITPQGAGLPIAQQTADEVKLGVVGGGVALELTCILQTQLWRGRVHVQKARPSDRSRDWTFRRRDG